MAERFDLLIFDWDGTLADSTGLITRAIRAAFEELALPVPTPAQASFVIGFGLTEAMQYLAPGADADTLIEIVERYKRHYLARDADIVLFDGVREALAHFRDAGYQLAVATGKSRRGLDRAMANTGLGEFFHCSRCADECQSKPHPQMIDEICRWLGIDAQRAVMIGDTTHDLQMAANAGAQALAVTYGAHPREELAALAPLALFDTFAQFDDWMRRHG